MSLSNISNDDDDSSTTLGSDSDKDACQHATSENDCQGFHFSKQYSIHTISETDSDEDMFTSIHPKKKAKLESVSGATNTKSDNTTAGSTSSTLPMCRYGAKCYRKNPTHFLEFQHPKGNMPLPKWSESSAQSMAKSKQESEKWTNKFGFYLSQVRDLNVGAVPEISIREILSASMGKLKASAQFSYMFEIPWLISQFPFEYRSVPMLIVHGEQGASKTGIDMEASQFPNVTTCQARLEMMYGTHHTKMMLLLYEDGMRVVIFTANLIERDWCQKTQGVWVSDKFPKLSTGASREVGDSPTQFKRDLLLYLSAYNHARLKPWLEEVEKHDFSTVKVFLIASVPGRHKGEKINSFGHMKVKKILGDECTSTQVSASTYRQWPLIGQFSSIGSLGNEPNQWLLSEWRRSFQGDEKSSETSARLTKLIFPCRHDVRTSLEGYPAGGSLPYSSNTAKKQTWLKGFLHKWRAVTANRTRASPHIKSYARCSPDGSKISWFMLTSANLSKAAWGSLEKRGDQLMIRSYELGVLFLPTFFDCEQFVTKTACVTSSNAFPVPFDLPPVPYDADDQPWIVDLPYTDLPDSHGNIWLPR